ncbi:MAG: sigma-70 family RNA polymerase sigma factor [Planctomyces sp.]|nr:sigma-70 family RNA polymerase sigma factor [Planctomyces sp.]
MKTEPLPANSTITDRMLLKQFADGDDEAFATLVRRHAGLVSSVCLRILRQSCDSDDAFQATFLVLARKAKRIAWQESISGWLHQTAIRTALRLRARTIRHRNIEAQVVTPRDSIGLSSEPGPEHQATLKELSEILDAELAGLPDKFREVILLCQVEGLNRDEAAVRLSISPEAVKDRLERGREQLRSRLLKRGLTLSSVAIAAWCVQQSAQAADSVGLVTATIRTGTVFAAGNMTATSGPAVMAGSVGMASSTAITLAQEVLRMMSIGKLKMVTAFVISLLTAGTLVYGMLRDEPTRFEQGLLGEVIAVQAGTPHTLTIELEEFSTLLNLDISAEAKVRTAFEEGDIADVRSGQFVSLRLGKDHRTIEEIHVRGQVREASIQSIDESGRISILEESSDGEDNLVSSNVKLAPDAILRIGGLPARREELRAGMEVPLEFSREGGVVNAIEAEGEDEQFVEGVLLTVQLSDGKLLLSLEEEDDRWIQKDFRIDSGTLTILDGKSVTPGDLPAGSSVKCRLGSDRLTVRAIKATSPESGDDDE